MNKTAKLQSLELISRELARTVARLRELELMQISRLLRKNDRETDGNGKRR
jgi:hypothetical protein